MTHALITGQLPFVSVTVPVYNGEDMIGECIEALLGQDYPKDLYEVIIVDNGSTDGTAAVIKCYPVTYVLEDNVHSAGGARNAGAWRAKGEALAFCDSDQVAAREWLRELVSHWDEDGHAGFVGPYVPKAFGGTLFELYAASLDRSYMLGEGLREVEVWGTGNLCVRAADFQRVGGFRSAIVSGDDTDLCWRLCKLTGQRFLYIGTAIQYHRARRSIRECVRKRFRLGFGVERSRAHHMLRVNRGMGEAALVLAWFWLRLPVLVPKIVLFGAQAGRRLALLGVAADPVIDSADLLGRLAYHLALPEKSLSGM